MKLATFFMKEAWSRPPALDAEHGGSRALAAPSFGARPGRMWVCDASIGLAVVRFARRFVRQAKARVAVERGARA